GRITILQLVCELVQSEFEDQSNARRDWLAVPVDARLEEPLLCRFHRSLIETVGAIEGLGHANVAHGAVLQHDDLELNLALNLGPHRIARVLGLLFPAHFRPADAVAWRVCTTAKTTAGAGAHAIAGTCTDSAASSTAAIVRHRNQIRSGSLQHRRVRRNRRNESRHRRRLNRSRHGDWNRYRSLRRGNLHLLHGRGRRTSTATTARTGLRHERHLELEWDRLLQHFARDDGENREDYGEQTAMDEERRAQRTAKLAIVRMRVDAIRTEPSGRGDRPTCLFRFGRSRRWRRRRTGA